MITSSTTFNRRDRFSIGEAAEAEVWMSSEAPEDVSDIVVVGDTLFVSTIPVAKYATDDFNTG